MKKQRKHNTNKSLPILAGICRTISLKCREQMSGITFRKPTTVHYMTSSFLFYLASWCLAAEVKTAIMPNLNYCYLFRFFFPQNYPCCCHYHWMSSFLPMPNWLPTAFQVRKVTFQQPRKLSSSFSE